LRTIVITLARSADRQKHMTGEFERAGLPFEFFYGVDGPRGEHLRFKQYDEKRTIRFFGKAMGVGEVGCWASHYLVWQKCVELNEPVLVVEDDVKLKPGFAGLVKRLEPLMEDHRLIRLYGLVKRPYRKLKDLGDGFTLIRFLRGPAGTQCYAISPAGAKTLLAGAESWREPVDRYMDRFWRHGLPSLAIMPYLLAHVGYGQLPSDVQSWARTRTPYTFWRKLVRMGEHGGRHAFNIWHYLKAPGKARAR
jgi:glycosyl transferase family 25